MSVGFTLGFPTRGGIWRLIGRNRGFGDGFRTDRRRSLLFEADLRSVAYFADIGRWMAFLRVNQNGRNSTDDTFVHTSRA